MPKKSASKVTAEETEVVEDVPEVKKVKKTKKAKKTEEIVEEVVAQEEPPKKKKKATKTEADEEETKTPAASAGDETINCKDCGADFVFTVAQQEFFASKGFDNKPLRCKECQHAKKTRMDGGGGRGGGAGRGAPRDNVCYNCQETGHMSYDCPKPKQQNGGGGRGGGGRGGGGRGGPCYAFQKGECTRGTSCKFSH